MPCIALHRSASAELFDFRAQPIECLEAHCALRHRHERRARRRDEPFKALLALVLRAGRAGRVVLVVLVVEPDVGAGLRPLALPLAALAREHAKPVLAVVLVVQVVARHVLCIIERSLVDDRPRHVVDGP